MLKLLRKGCRRENDEERSGVAFRRHGTCVDNDWKFRNFIRFEEPSTMPRSYDTLHACDGNTSAGFKKGASVLEASFIDKRRSSGLQVATIASSVTSSRSSFVVKAACCVYRDVTDASMGLSCVKCNSHVHILFLAELKDNRSSSCYHQNSSIPLSTTINDAPSE